MEQLLGLAPLLLIFVVFYFVLIRPQQKRQKETVQMQSSLQVGDKIVTIGGLHGIIETIDEEKRTITLKSTDGSRMVFDRGAIREVKQQI